MDQQPIEDLPGYRRRILVDARDEIVVAMLEDDFHSMAVTLRHDGERIVAIDPFMERAPWTTCPGAIVQLRQTFAPGQELAQVTARREKRENCTHLHDLAVLAAVHAHDRARIVYDVQVSDPVEGLRRFQIQRDGEMLFRWAEQERLLVAPPEIAGLELHRLRDWIATLPETLREPARVLQWASMVGRGRAVMGGMTHRTIDRPPDCFAAQPERAADGRRAGEWIDFSDFAEKRRPLGGLREKVKR